MPMPTVMIAVGLYLVFVLEASSRLRSAAVTILCLALGAAYASVLLLPFAREFFALAQPTPAIVLIAAGGVLVALGVLILSSDLFVPGVVNTRDWRGAEIPAANGHGNARAVARFYGALARGGELEGPDGQAIRVLTPEAMERATAEQAYGRDAVMGLSLRTALGFVLTSPDARLGPNPRAFGHSGAGGSLGFADPDAKVGFGYTMNRMLQEDTLTDPRWAPLIDAVYSAV